MLDGITLDRPVKSQDLELSLSGLNPRWYHLSIRAIFNSQDVKVEYQTSLHDITELKAYFEKSQALLQELHEKNVELEHQAEELRIAHLALEESRDKYHNLYDLAPLCHLTITDDGWIAEANHAGAVLFGTERKDLIRHEFHKFVSPDCMMQWEKFINLVRKQDDKQTCSLMLLKEDGSAFPARLDGIRISEMSGVITIRIMIRDISDVRMAEAAMREIDERFRTVVEQSPLVTFVVDKTGIITLSEGKGLARLGFEPHEVVGSSVFDVFADTPPICEAGRMALSGESQKFIVEVANATFETFFNPIRDNSGEVSSFIWVASDITDRIIAEETLKNATKKLNMLHQFTRHNMINKMTVLFGYLNMLDQNLPESSPLRKSFDHLKTAADEINRLVIFSRNFQTLGVKPAKWHNLKKIVEKSVATVRPRNVNLDIALDSVEVFSDPLIENVFVNLIDNSLRHGKNVTCFDHPSLTGPKVQVI
jgi:PAS domain S-box-containing protein